MVTDIYFITLSNEIQYIARLNETNRSHEELVSSKSIKKRKLVSIEPQVGWIKLHEYKPIKKRKLLPDESNTGWKNLDLFGWKVYPKIIYRWCPIDHTWSTFLRGVLVKQKPNLPYEVISNILEFTFQK